MKLVVEFDFSEAADFDYYRQQFVTRCESMADDAMDEEEGGKADGTIEVNWDTED